MLSRTQLAAEYATALKLTITYLIDINNQTSYTVSNLRDGKTHYMAATAYHREGNESPQWNVTVSYGGSKTFTIKLNANCKVDDVKVEETHGLLRKRMK